MAFRFVKDACRKAMEAGAYDYKAFPELSYSAWMASEQVNREKAAGGRKASKAAILRWFKPLIQALRDLGGSASPADARKRIMENENLTAEEVCAVRGKNNVNKFENEVAFARNYLVNAGFIDKSLYGVWTLTKAGMASEITDEMASDIYKMGVSEIQGKRENSGAALADNDVDTVNYWIYAPGKSSSMWEGFYNAGIMAIGWGEIGDLKAFDTKDAMKIKMKEIYDATLSYKNAAHATWQFANEMKAGDVIILPGYEYGTSLRIYNPDTLAWDVAYGYTGKIIRLEARKQEDMVVLTCVDDERRKWVFTKIEDNSFHWQNVTVKNNGEWHINADMYAERI